VRVSLAAVEQLMSSAFVLFVLWGVLGLSPAARTLFLAGLWGGASVVAHARPVVGLDVELAGVHHPPTIPGVTLTFDTLEERGAFTVVVDDAAGQLVRLDTRSFTVMPSVPC